MQGSPDALHQQERGETRVSGLRFHGLETSHMLVEHAMEW